MPQFAHLQNGNTSCMYVMHLLGASASLHVKCQAQPSVNVRLRESSLTQPTSCIQLTTKTKTIFTMSPTSPLPFKLPLLLPSSARSSLLLIGNPVAKPLHRPPRPLYLLPLLPILDTETKLSFRICNHSPPSCKNQRVPSVNEAPG